LAAGVITTAERVVFSALAPQRVTVWMLGILAGVAMLLAMLGIYGVMSYTVAQRTHEIGVRVALGAQPGDVLRSVMGAGLRLAAIGLAIGVAGALALSRGIAVLLHGVSPTDPLTFTVVVLVLA